MSRPDVQAILRFTGTVQGVGFRYTACRIAGGYAITGTVRNCPDGTVECIAEGTRDEIRAFRDDVKAEMARYIRQCTCQWAPASGRFTDFSVSL